MGTTATLQPTFVTLCRSHRCRSSQIFGGAKDFCPNFPKLVPKTFGPLVVQMFSHEDCCWDDLQKKSLCNFARHFYPYFHRVCYGFSQLVPRCPQILPRFSGILPKFSPHQNFGGAFAPPCTSASYTTSRSSDIVKQRFSTAVQREHLWAMCHNVI